MSQVLEFLECQYMFDMHVFSEYWPFAPIYAIWFLVKWAFLTAPVSIPLSACRAVIGKTND